MGENPRPYAKRLCHGTSFASSEGVPKGIHFDIPFRDPLGRQFHRAEGSGATQERRLAALQPVAGEPRASSFNGGNLRNGLACQYACGYAKRYPLGIPLGTNCLARTARDRRESFRAPLFICV